MWWIIGVSLYVAIDILIYYFIVMEQEFSAFSIGEFMLFLLLGIPMSVCVALQVLVIDVWPAMHMTLILNLIKKRVQLRR